MGTADNENGAVDHDPADHPNGAVDERTWIESDHPIARHIARPMREFMHVETAGGIVLLAATLAALILANTPVGDSIANFWDKELGLLSIGDFHLEESLGHWINDGLMVIFFFVVGVEIKRELVDGELRDPRRAALPAIAAVGGMLVPALLFTALNAGGDGAGGWGIPMATDIAFAVGVMALLGDRVPSPLKVFLLTLAIVDDIGAILVIAIFYSEDLSFGWLAIAGLLIAVVVGLRLARVWYIPVYVVVGIGVWVAMLESGIHATIAGVILGLLTPAKPLRRRATHLRVDKHQRWAAIRSTIFDAKETVPVAERLQHLVHPWAAFVILPLFAFANAGIPLSADGISDAATSPVTLGVILGLVIGKPLGITIAAWLAVKSRVGSLPNGTNWADITGAGALAGIGFTVAMFVTGLAFTDVVLQDDAKIGILAASAVAACLGSYLICHLGHDESDVDDADAADGPDTVVSAAGGNGAERAHAGP